MTAEFVVRTCERFGCLPSALYAESADLISLLELEQLGGSRDPKE